MIPKKIHYCWFGNNPLPKSAVRCIESWKKYFPDYEIIEWNESNYDINTVPYVKDAYNAKKYAFVSDYARFDVIYKEGGIYFDTDVEVIKSFEDILEQGAFMGCEIDGNGASETIQVNPGLGIAAAPGLPLYGDILDYYATQKFILDDGSMNTETVVTKTTQLLKTKGLKEKNGIQKVADITIYPKEYFNPLNSNTGELEKTENTHSVHWYTMSWLSPMGRLKSKITRPIHRLFGEDIFHRRGNRK